MASEYHESNSVLRTERSTNVRVAFELRITAKRLRHQAQGCRNRFAVDERTLD